jgi:outer membrane lipoprotein-sorting protein
MRWHRGIVAIGLGLTVLSLALFARAADVQPAQAIVDQVARLYISQSSIATMEMQITKADVKRTISMQVWSLGASKMLVRIVQPQDDAGTAILKLGDRTWIYLPKSKRTFAMPPSMMMTSWMGGHFTLDDLVNQGRLSDDYAIATSFEGQRDGVAVSEYTLTPKPDAAVVWGKITLQVRQADHMPVWQRFYDEDGKLVQELSFSDYKTMSGRLIPTRLVMRPSDQAVEQTSLTYDSIVFDAPVSEDMFVLRNLK